MKIADLKNKGLLPKEIDENMLVSLANRLGIINFSMDIELDKDMANRILYSPEVNNYKVKKELSTIHEGVVKRYESLINGYKKLIVGLGSREGFDDEKKAMQDLIEKLETEKESYQNTINGFSLGNTSQYFDFGNEHLINKTKNEIFKSISSDNDEKQAKIDEKLNHIYRNLNNAKSSKNRTMTGKLRQAFRVKKLEKQVERLQKKQGLLRNNQSKLIEFNTNLYINNMEKRFSKYFEELDKINDTLENKKYIQDEIESINNDKEELNSQNESLTTQGLNASFFEGLSLSSKKRKNTKEIEKMERQLQRLNLKMGSVNLQDQYKRVFEREYSR